MKSGGMPSQAARLPVYILAGGESRRFGSDKARAVLHGTPLILRQAAMLRAGGHAVFAVAEAAGKYADLGIETLGDERPGCGPLGGLLTALTHCQLRGQTRLLLSACDVLDLRPEWITALAEAAHEGGAAFHGERWQPIPGVYSTSVVVKVREHLDRGEFSLWRILAAAGAAAVPLPADWPVRFQANSQDELREFADPN